MHRSFVITASHSTYGDGQGIAGLMCVAVTFRVPPQCRVSAGLVILRKYTPVEFSIIKSRAMTLSRFPQCKAFSRAVKDENFPHRCGGREQWLQMTAALVSLSSLSPGNGVICQRQKDYKFCSDFSLEKIGIW